MPSTIDYKFGDILLVQFPKTDMESSIKRPAVTLLDTGDEDVVVARITTHPVRGKGDLAVADWKECGLLAESTIRLSKLATLNKTLVTQRLGILTEKSARSLRQIYSSLLD